MVGESSSTGLDLGLVLTMVQSVTLRWNNVPVYCNTLYPRIVLYALSRCITGHSAKLYHKFVADCIVTSVQHK